MMNNKWLMKQMANSCQRTAQPDYGRQPGAAQPFPSIREPAGLLQQLFQQLHACLHPCRNVRPAALLLKA